MKKALLIILALVMSLGLCVNAFAEEAGVDDVSPEVKAVNEYVEINWREIYNKYRYDDSVNQLLFIQQTEGSHALFTLYVKEHTASGNVVWTEALSCDGFIGKNGLGGTTETNIKTPTGDFGITVAFGIRENPGTVLPYIDVKETTYACTCEEYYNQIIDSEETGHVCEDGEHLIDYSPEYNYGFLTDYNKDGVYDAGSALFVHCTGFKDYTGGCMAVPEDVMKTLLLTLDQNARVVIGVRPQP